MQTLSPTETFTAGDFPVTVLEVRGARGTFSDKGYVVVPYLADTKLEVVFKNIRKRIVSKYLEYKSWKKSSFSFMQGDQFRKQFKNYLKNGNFEYVFDRAKLIKEGVPNPDQFVREQFQKMFQKNAEELFKVNEDFFKQFKKTNGKNITDWGDLILLESKNPLFNFINVE